MEDEDSNDEIEFLEFTPNVLFGFEEERVLPHC